MSGKARLLVLSLCVFVSLCPSFFKTQPPACKRHLDGFLSAFLSGHLVSVCVCVCVRLRAHTFVRVCPWSCGFDTGALLSARETVGYRSPALSLLRPSRLRLHSWKVSELPGR